MNRMSRGYLEYVVKTGMCRLCDQNGAYALGGVLGHQ
jgi:hypothetical protein